MKTKNIHKLIFLLLSTLLVGSCSEDRLYQVPLAMESEESLLLTETGPEQALIGVYSVMLKQEYHNVGAIVCGSTSSDDAEWGGEGNGNDRVQDRLVGNLRGTSTSPVLKVMYQVLYQGIQRASVIVSVLPTIDYAISDAEANEIIAQARLLRAYYYFQLTKTFGPAVLYEGRIYTADVKGLTRSPINDVYNFISNEIDLAYPYLPEGPGEWRVTKALADMVKAKMFIFRSSYAKNYPGDERFAGMTQQWDSVIYYCNRIIDNPNYHLLGQNGETYESAYGTNTNALQYLWMVESENGPESIFEIQESMDRRVNTETYVNGRFIGMGTRFYHDGNVRNMYYNVKGANGQDSLILDIDVTERWGAHCPSKDFVDEAETYFPGDPRIDNWVARPGDSIFCDIDNEMKWAWYEFSQSPTGYGNKKTDWIHANYTGAAHEHNEGNIKVLRYADVLLLAAEANFMLGNEPKARELVNQIRTRARLNGTSGQPADYTSPITFEDIVRERRMELCFEFHRFYDLVRWNLADQEISGKETYWSGTIDFEPGKHEFFPIPELDILLSEGSIEQNPGY